VAQPMPDVTRARTWALDPGGSHVRVFEGANAVSLLAAADDASALVGDALASTGTEPNVRFGVSIRRPERIPTMEELAGTYLIGACSWGRPPRTRSRSDRAGA